MSNQYKHKPMPYGVKVRKLLCNAYYLRKEQFNALIQDLEHGNGTHHVTATHYTGEEGLITPVVETLSDMQYCIWMVDNYGEWLDS